MALTMGQIRKLLAAQGGVASAAQETAAELVADALLRSVAKQAIIAAAADAVAQLSAGEGSLRASIKGRPGGPIDDANPKRDDTGGEGERTTGP